MKFFRKLGRYYCRRQRAIITITVKTGESALTVSRKDKLWQIGSPPIALGPFPHFHVADILGSATQEILLEWLETEAPWRLAESDFYEQWEFDLLDVDVPYNAATHFSQEGQAGLRLAIERQFSVHLEPRVTAVAHKLLPGQRIAIHNDYLPGEETHRLTVQLNRGLRDEDGGFFLLFNSFDPSDVYTIIRPESGSAIGFEISERSHHAVSRMHGGERYTLVFSFFAKDRIHAD